MGLELGRILTAAGAVAAWTGIIVLGLGMAELTPGYPFAFGLSLVGLGVLVTVVGLVALVVGAFIYRAAFGADRSAR
jgi:hypothetical protein